MKDLISNLQTRYNAILQSDSNRSFYLNVHRYINLIVKTPVLAEIMDASEAEYTKKHGEIWREYKHTDAEIDEQEDRTIKLEQFSLFASDYCFVFIRIYQPLEIYRTTEHLKGKLAIMSNIMLGNSNGEMKKFDQNLVRLFSKWYTQETKKSYENHIRQFHQDFLPIIEQIKEPEDKGVRIPVVSERSRPTIIIDDKKGIYQKFNIESAYGIGRTSKRFKIIKYLQIKDNCSVTELSKHTNQIDKDVMKAISEINRLFRKNTGQNFDLITHSDTSGYSLNKDEFDIQTPPNL